MVKGNEFAAHLDAPAYNHIGEIEHVTANFAVDSATVENGCLEVVPGSHRMNASFLKGGQIHPDWEATHDWVSVPLEPGM
jgi:2-aminoethylphosphonate dioxygenase